MTTSPPSFLLKFQIGPVQDFIAQARSTRDLWSGSYLLSWLVAAGIKALPKGHELIFPCRDEQPLLKEPLDPKTPGVLIPNLPNIFIAKVGGDAESAASTVEQAIEAEWQRIAKTVWSRREQIGLLESSKDRFFAQVDSHLSISWQATPLADDSASVYRNAYQLNGWHLDAVRQTRDFSAWGVSSGEPHDKDSLSGKDEALFQGSGNADGGDVWHNLLNKHTDRLGAVTLIKRVWHLAYLKKKPHHLPTDSDQFNIRSIPAIAARHQEYDDEAPPQEKSTGNKYIAAIAFDGDSIGAWVNGDKSPPDTDLESHHSDFSRALSDFALGQARGIVETLVDETYKNGESKRIPLGQLIYAGGDDVVCLVPADAALEVAAKLREAFQAATNATPSLSDKPDASAGMAIAHVHSPLQDLIRTAQTAEKRAKNTVGRPAFSITLMKRSGEINHWGAKWDDGGIDLHNAILNLMGGDRLSAKFPHRVCQLLTPYLTRRTDLIEAENREALDADTAVELIRREFDFAIERQSSSDRKNENRQALVGPLKNYLGNLVDRHRQATADAKPLGVSLPQYLLQTLIELSTAAAFAHRDPPPAQTAERQAP